MNNDSTNLTIPNCSNAYVIGCKENNCYVKAYYEEKDFKDLYSIDINCNIRQLFSSEIEDEFIYDVANERLYRSFISDKIFNLYCLESKEQFSFTLLNVDETIVYATIEKGVLLTKTQWFNDRDETINSVHVFLIDTNQYYIIQDDLLKEATRIPYIATFNDKLYLIFEDTKFSSYEIPSLRLEFDEIVNTNRILCCEFLSVLKNSSQNEKNNWEVLAQSSFDSYVNLLDIKDNKIIILQVESKLGTSEIRITNNNNDNLGFFTVPQIINYYINMPAPYFISWFNDKISIFDYNGKLITAFFSISEFQTEQSIDLNQIVAIKNNEQIIFDATQDMNGINKQVRVIYDTNKIEFTIKGTLLEFYNNVLV